MDWKYKQSSYSYYPIAADSSSGGLGLRDEVRSMQFAMPSLQDIRFGEDTITNLSDRNYDESRLSTGIYFYQLSTPGHWVIRKSLLLK
jgi:hypothetical protein